MQALRNELVFFLVARLPVLKDGVFPFLPVVTEVQVVGDQATGRLYGEELVLRFLCVL